MPDSFSAIDRAKTLREAYRACDVGPLRGETQHYYVDLSKIRSREAIDSISTQLEFLNAGEFEVLLFTGHRGCGKSTELRRLQREWETDYRVIYLEADREIDINDAEYTDIYLVIIKQVADELAKLKLHFDKALLANFQKWFLEITNETTESVEKSVGLETSAEAGWEFPFISKLIAKLQAQIKGSNTQKQVIRETLQKSIGRLQLDINLLLGDAFKKLTARYKAEGKYQKGFLIIFDNLDRVPPRVGDHLYFDYATQLRQLQCSIIYTVPISVVYSDKNLNNAFQSASIVPMVNIYQFQHDRWDLDCEPAIVAALSQLITKRMDAAAVFDNPDRVLDLVKASGGHVRQLMQLTAAACLVAATRKHARVQVDDIDYAIKQEQFNFERVIPADSYPELAAVCFEKQVPQTEKGQRLLFNTSILEYNGDRRWNYVNPGVKGIEAFQQAIQKIHDTQSP